MTRLPREGMNKTRLIPALGPAGAAAFHERLARHAIGRASAFCLQSGAQLTVRLVGGTTIEGKSWLGSQHLDCKEQGSGDLGEKMEDAVNQAFSEGSKRVVVIGTDCPSIDERILAEAFKELLTHDVVFGPALDGGYYLVGLKKPTPSIFKNITWGGDDVLESSLYAAGKAGLSTSLLTPLSDVDFPDDLPNAEARLREGSSVSVIIPTLNEESNIGQLIEYLKQFSPHEIIVSDGGSIDNTLEQASFAGAITLNSSRGRARQMNEGAAVATGENLLFLHADTLPPSEFPSLVSSILNIPGTAAGAFKFKLKGDYKAAALIEGLVWLRCRLFQTPYGDQGIFVRRSIFNWSGGFPDTRVAEDLHFIRKLRKIGKVRVTEQTCATSPRRWERHGLVRTFIKHQLILIASAIRIPIFLGGKR